MDGVLTEAVGHICDHLHDRTAVLFLGAGINYGIQDQGQAFPLAAPLAKEIAKELLGEELNLPLDQVADMARHRVGARPLNEFLYKSFARFKPGVQHVLISQLPWDIIYTTNYDSLVETAAANPATGAAGVIKPVFSLGDDLSNSSERDILYYKLHGCINYANTPGGRLILTKDDFRHYQDHRRPLFRRLARDLVSRSFLFVGYSITDDNFLATLSDCRDELGISNLPKSYAVRPGFSKAEEMYWLDKYNIQLLNCDGTEFLSLLKQTWDAQYGKPLTFSEKLARNYESVDNRESQFERIGTDLPPVWWTSR